MKNNFILLCMLATMVTACSSNINQTQTKEISIEESKPRELITQQKQMLMAASDMYKNKQGLLCREFFRFDNTDSDQSNLVKGCEQKDGNWTFEKITFDN